MILLDVQVKGCMQQVYFDQLSKHDPMYDFNVDWLNPSIRTTCYLAVKHTYQNIFFQIEIC